MQSHFNSSCEAIFGDVASNSQKTIEDCTVYTERIIDNGSYYLRRYSGKNKEMVQKYAQDVFDGVDKMRSPTMSSAQPYRDGYCIELGWHGLD